MMTITWEEALEEICDKFTKIEQEYGSEAIWPYYYAGTMGLVMRDGINRLRHEKKYSENIRQYARIKHSMVIW